MDYRSYQKSRDLAWEILLHERVCALPVDVLAICRGLGVRVVEYIDPCPEVAFLA